MLLQINKLYILKVVLKKLRVPLLLREGLFSDITFRGILTIPRQNKNPLRTLRASACGFPIMLTQPQRADIKACSLDTAVPSGSKDT